MNSNSQVFVAFQVNPICDTTKADLSFEKEFITMKRDLHQDGVHIASLSTNLRNTKNIGEVSRNVKSFNSSFANCKMTEHIQPLVVKSTNVASSRPPLLIPMFRKNREKHLKQALVRALERVEHSTKNVVIIYDERSLPSYEIYQLLLECGEEAIFNHPNKCNDDDPTQLINYLKQPKGIYVVPDVNFVGMESNSVILISNQSDYDFNVATSIRCNISRAVSQLTIIMEMKEDAFSLFTGKILFHSTEVDPSFVECQKTIKWYAFKCNSIHSNSLLTSPSLSPILEQLQYQKSSSPILKWFNPEKYVCEPCIHICHNNHKDRLSVIFGGGNSFLFSGSKLSLSLGAIKSTIGMVARAIKLSIVGGTRCCCKEIAECKISDVNLRSNSSHPLKWVVSGFLALFVFYDLLKHPIDELVSTISEPNFFTINSVINLIWPLSRLWFLYQILRS